jgi:hypothetical protein
VIKLAELIQAGGETVGSVIHELTISILNEKEMPNQKKKFIIVPIHKKVDTMGLQ